MTSAEFQQLGAYRPYTRFTQAANAVLKSLYDRVPFDLWMLTQVKEEDWIVLVAENHGYDAVKEGDVYQWSDSLCSRMVKGLGPNFASECQNINAYREAPINKKLKISSYIGYPIVLDDGSLFGTLCAIHPEVSDCDLEQHKNFIIHQARLLATLLTSYQNQYKKQNELQNEKLMSQMDELTGVHNRRGWNLNLDIEEHRAQRESNIVSVIMIDVDDLKLINDSEGHHAGDELLIKVAECLKMIVRPYDLVSRIGGDEFAILLANTNQKDAGALVERIRAKFIEYGINASIGYAVKQKCESIKHLVDLADQLMYDDKKIRKATKH